MTRGDTAHHPRRMPSSDEMFDAAVRYHRGGRLDVAERLYRKLLKAHPGHDGVLHLLGLVEAERGRLGRARELISQAVRRNPAHAPYRIDLGLTLKRLGRREEAEAALQAAIAREPSAPEGHTALGNLLLEQGRYVEALAAFEQALASAPEHVPALGGAGIALQAMRRGDEALVRFRRAVRVAPGDVDAQCNLALALQLAGELEGAVAHFREALAIDPQRARVHNGLGLTLAALGRLEEARAALETALQRAPDFPEALDNLASVLLRQGDPAGAVERYRTALALDPDRAGTLANLGSALLALERVAEARAALERSLALAPDQPHALNNLATVLRAAGDVAGAAERFRRAVAAAPDYVAAHSNYLSCLNYLPAYDPAQILAEHRRFAERFEAPLRGTWPQPRNTPDPDRRLRIGYVSGDFCAHPMAHSVEPVLAHHDRRCIEVFCFSNNARSDAVTERLRRHADHWYDIAGMTDAVVAELVRAHVIDILVDLSGHTALGRLMVFARKPAPVQTAWLGYVTTSGLAAIDYRLTDTWADPPGISETHYTEKLARMPHVMAFQPDAESPPVGPLPAAGGAAFTFASLNHLAKVTPEVVRLWARVLAQVPESRLLLGAAGDEAVRARYAALFADQGIGASRLAFQPRLPMAEYLASHGAIDLALDPFPYNGGATSCHALWMGVPFVTLAGDRYMARMGESLLQAAGLPEFVARTEDQYVALAASLARDVARLAVLRRTLRERVVASPLFDAPAFARGLEAAYREMWRAWCAVR
ncbi:MAG: tetratricopeptide repeat protein [Burkholderiales bacterium]|nr:tetratricopeptide repeat protein [Burkholderiales bacterium]